MEIFPTNRLARFLPSISSWSFQIHFPLSKGARARLNKQHHNFSPHKLNKPKPLQHTIPKPTQRLQGMASIIVKRPFTAQELEEMAVYEGIVAFAEQVMAGMHPRVKIPAHLVCRPQSIRAQDIKQTNLPCLESSICCSTSRSSSRPACRSSCRPKSRPISRPSYHSTCCSSSCTRYLST